MKISILSAAFMLLFTGILFSQPKIEFENGDIYNWGNVKPKDSPLKGKVRIFNRGDQQLHIFSVRPGCGCTTAPLDKKIIDPNDFATLEITFHTGSGVGDQEKFIYIESNDPLRKVVNYTLRAKVNQALSTYPSFFSFDEMYLGKYASTTITLKNNSEHDILVTDVITFPKNMQLNIKADDIIPARAEKPLTAGFVPQELGQNKIKVTIKTNSKELPEFEISGWGAVIIEPKTTE